MSIASATPDVSPLQQPKRLVSLDAYRGFTMLFLVSGAFGIKGTAQIAIKSFEVGSWQHSTLAFLQYQFSHPNWLGFSLWDLIQPSFMFLVGTSMAYSYAKRAARGDSYRQLLGHAIYRSIFLILLGVFLRSNPSDWNRVTMTRWTFEDVVSQIGLGYVFLFLLWNRSRQVQIGAVVFILVGYWALFVGPSIPEETPDQLLKGFGAHWNPYNNPANEFDRWFLNLFPREYVFTEHKYNTLNFIPSLATMILGLIAGEILRSGRTDREKIRTLVVAGISGVALAFLLDPARSLPLLFNAAEWLGIVVVPQEEAARLATWSLCPISKMAWTPTWVLYSGGIATLLLAGSYALIDAGDWKRPRWLSWAIFPGLVFGVNSIAAYVMSGLMGKWIVATIGRHGVAVVNWWNGEFGTTYESIFQMPLGPTFAPIVANLARMTVIFLILLWMYRRKIFLRI